MTLSQPLGRSEPAGVTPRANQLLFQCTVRYDEAGTIWEGSNF